MILICPVAWWLRTAVRSLYSKSGFSNAAGSRVSSLLVNYVTNGAVAFQPTLVHSCEHRNQVVHVIVDLDHTLVVMKTVQSPHVLLERPLPRDGHRQEERIQTRVVKSFANVASGRQDCAWLALRHGGESFGCCAPLLSPHA